MIQKARILHKIPVWVILAIAILIAAWLRTDGLANTIVWYDEALTFMHISGQSVNTALEDIDCKDGPVTFKLLLDNFQNRDCSLKDVRKSLSVDQPEHAPAFFEGLYFWRSIVKNDLPLLRLFPLLFGLLTLPAFYWFAFELFRSRSTSLLATIMVAVSPLQIAYSQELREYSLYCLVSSLSCAAFLRAWRTNTLKDWLLYGCISVVGFLSTFWMLLISGAHVLYSIGATLVRRGMNNRVHPIRPHAVRSIAHIVILTLSLCAVSPVISSLIVHHQRAQSMVQWLELPISKASLTNAWLYDRLFGWLYHPWYQFTMAKPGVIDTNHPAFVITLCIELWAICFMGKTKRMRPQLAFILFIALSFVSILDAPDALFGGRRSTVVRYFLPVTMLAFLPVCCMVSEYWRQRSLLHRFCAIVIVLFLTTCQLSSFNAMRNCRERGTFLYQIEPVARLLNENPDTLVIAKREAIIFPNLLAIGRLLENQNRSFAWFKKDLPDWFNRVDRFYMIVVRPGEETRCFRSGYTATSPEKGIVLFRAIARTKPDDQN